MFYKISKAFLYLAFLAPLLLIKPLFFPFIAGKALFFRTVVELALLFFLFHVLAHLQQPEFLKNLRRKLSHPIVITLAVFALAVVFTALIGVNPTQSFWSNFERGDGAFQILHYVIFGILGILLFTDKKSLERMIVTNIMISLPMSVYAIFQLTADSANNPAIIAPGARVSGTLGNPSYLAAYLIFILAFVAYFIVTRREEIKHYLYLLLGVPFIGGVVIWLGLRDWSAGGQLANSILNNAAGKVMLWYFGVALTLYLVSLMDKKWFQTITLYAIFIFNFFILLKTGTRGAFLAIIAGILVVAAVNFFINRDRRVRMILGSIFAGVIVLSGIFFATHQAPLWQQVPILNRLVNFTSATTDIKPRLWTWGSGLAATIERPLVGWGIEGFATPFDKYYNPNHYGIESFFDRTHNIFLEYSVSGGLLVLLPWLAIFYFYYRRLRQRPKDLWYSILFAVPIMYLVQGFFLFDTLPIYIAFFAFLMLFINTEAGEVHLSPTEPRLRGINIATAGILTIGTVLLIHQTIVLPLQKNKLLVRALIAQGDLVSNAGTPNAVTPDKVIAQFHDVLKAPGPIGQEEAIGAYQKFILSLVENASQNPQMTNSAQARREVRRVVDDANTWFDSHRSIFPGLKQTYINGGLNLRAGLSFGQTDLLSRGRKQFTDALALAPTRLEFISVMIQLAKAERDMQALETWGARAESYRPDLFNLAELKKSLSQ